MSAEPGFQPVDKMTLAKLSNSCFLQIDLILNNVTALNIV